MVSACVFEMLVCAEQGRLVNKHQQEDEAQLKKCELTRDVGKSNHTSTASMFPCSDHIQNEHLCCGILAAALLQCPEGLWGVLAVRTLPPACCLHPGRAVEYCDAVEQTVLQGALAQLPLALGWWQDWLWQRIFVLREGKAVS